MTTQQNKALHLYLQFVADALNELGMEYEHENGFYSRFTMLIVKDKIWRRIQKTMFGIESTTKISSKQINEIVDVMTKYLGDRGVVLEFPEERPNQITVKQFINQ